MNGETLQMLQLVLSTRRAMTGQQSFQYKSGEYESTTRFECINIGGEKRKIGSVEEWYQYMLTQGMEHVGMLINLDPSNRDMLGFANAHPNSLVVRYRSHLVTSFTPIWNFNQNESKWRIVYKETVWNDAPASCRRFVDNRKQFIEALTRAEKLAGQIDADFFAKTFAKARSILEDPGQIPDTTMENWPGMTRKDVSMILAASEADVFAGMGSWNDTPAAVADHKNMMEQYIRVSNELLRQVRLAILFAGNESVLYGQPPYMESPNAGNIVDAAVSPEDMRTAVQMGQVQDSVRMAWNDQTMQMSQREQSVTREENQDLTDEQYQNQRIRQQTETARPAGKRKKIGMTLALIALTMMILIPMAIKKASDDRHVASINSTVVSKTVDDDMNMDYVKEAADIVESQKPKREASNIDALSPQEKQVDGIQKRIAADYNKEHDEESVLFTVTGTENDYGPATNMTFSPYEENYNEMEAMKFTKGGMRLEMNIVTQGTAEEAYQAEIADISGSNKLVQSASGTEDDGTEWTSFVETEEEKASGAHRKIIIAKNKMYVFRFWVISHDTVAEDMNTYEQDGTRDYASYMDGQFSQWTDYINDQGIITIPKLKAPTTPSPISR